MPDSEVLVLIVGGSLVGPTTAMLLGHHGVESLSVERHAGTAIHPRAGHFQLRTMEVLRQQGLEARVRAKSAETYSPTGGIIAVESLAGQQLATYVQELNEGVEGFSPTVRVFINQDALEPLLRERALELGAQVRNRTEAVALDQDDDGVTVTLRGLDAGDEHQVRARYVVAADGNRSPMRRLLGIGMRGYGQLSRSITIYFRADCSELLRDRNQGVIYVHNPELRGFFRIDRTGGTGSSSSTRSARTSRRSRRSTCSRGSRASARSTTCAPRSGPTCRWSSSTSRTGTRRRTGPSGSSRAACSSRATPRTWSRRTAASAGTPACRTRSTSPGSSLPSSRARPGRRWSTRTRPSACRCRA